MISIILATYNECDNIEEMIDRIFRYIRPQVEVIVVDDNSTDGTWQKVEAMNHPSVTLIRRTRERGLASAILRGIVDSRGDIIGWWDCDMMMCPEKAPEMIKKLNGCDIAIGSRYVHGGRDDRDAIRVLSSKAINHIAGFVLGYGIKDYDSGFVMMRRPVLNLCLPVPTGFGEYFIEFIYCCAKRGASFVEVPYVLTEREHGNSKARHRFVVYGMRYLIRIAIAKVRGHD
jgi:dolichol-phosphate mannosyltransferase